MSEGRVPYHEAIKQAAEGSAQRFQAIVLELHDRITDLEQENERLRRKLEDLGHKESSGGWHHAVDHVVDNGDGTYSHHLTRPT